MRNSEGDLRFMFNLLKEQWYRTDSKTMKDTLEIQMAVFKYILDDPELDIPRYTIDNGTFKS